jgi:pentachlorophenol monooxygenase/3-(3-hydroxy-phenyl)propionate hydroxylase
VRPTHPILVVGGGPTALVATLALAQRGIPCRLVDGPGVSPEAGGRATLLARASLEILGRALNGPSVVDLGIPIEQHRVLHKRRQIGEERFLEAGGPDGPLPPYLAVPTRDLVELLYEAVAREPAIEVVLGGRVLGVRQDARTVTLTVETEAGLETMEGSHLLAADGPRSLVRGALGIPFPGRTHDEKLLLVEARAEPPFPRERRLVLDPPGSGGVGVALPFAADRWQLAFMVDGDFQLQREAARGAFDRRIAGMLDGAPFELVWSRLDRIHDRRAQRLREGRVLLAGSSGLVLPPFGAHTSNLALGDAEQAAFRLALVARGLGDEAEQLDRYAEERGAAASAAQDDAQATLSFLAPGSWTGLTARNAALRGLSIAPRSRDRLAPARPFRPSRPLATVARLIDRCEGLDLGEPPEEARSAIPRVEGPAAPGTLAPDGPCTLQPRRTRTRLRALFGPSFVGLFFPGSRVSVDFFAAWAQERTSAAPFRLYLVTRAQQALEAGRVPGFDAVLVDAESKLRRRFGVPDNTPALFIVRPDGIVAGRICDLDGPDLTAVLEEVTGCFPEDRSSTSPGPARATPGRNARC